jgi:hypothetical protein
MYCAEEKMKKRNWYGTKPAAAGGGGELEDSVAEGKRKHNRWGPLKLH